MPSVDDVYNQLLAANTKLDAIDAAVNNVTTAVNTVNSTLNNGFNQLITEGAYTNAALYQNSLQNDAIICLLRQISEHTCGIWNETHVETGLQKTMRDDLDELTDLYATTHADAALVWEHEQKLKKQIEACCPPEEEPPICRDREKCPAPKEMPKPPKTKGGTVGTTDQPK